MKKYSTSISTLIKRKELSQVLNLENSLSGGLDSIDAVKKRLLRQFGYDIDTIDLKTSEVTLEIATDKEFVKMNPTITRSYYDEDDILTQKVKKVNSDNDLVTFEGEIYEKLSFSDDNEAMNFAKEHGYRFPLYADTTSLLHFKGLEWNQKDIKKVIEMKNITEAYSNILNDKQIEILTHELGKTLKEKELYVIKNKNMFTVYYDSPLHYMNKTKESGFSEEEIGIIIPLVEHLDSSYFVLYVRDALNVLNMNRSNRGYNPKEKFISDESMETYIECITDSAANIDDLVYVKLKVVSDTPVILDDSVMQAFDEKQEIAKKFQKIRQ